jgi:hypothetical protein
MNNLFKTSLNVMPHDRKHVPVTLIVPRNSIFMSQLKNLMDHLIPAGIPEFIEKFEKWRLFRPVDVETEDPRKVLTLEMLDFGFYIWLGACCVSCVVFVCELLWWMVTRRLRKLLQGLIGLFNFLRVLKARVADYHDRW